MKTMKEVKAFLSHVKKAGVHWDKLTEAEEIKDAVKFKEFMQRFHSPLIVDILYNPDSDAVLYIQSDEAWVKCAIEFKFKTTKES